MSNCIKKISLIACIIPSLVFPTLFIGTWTEEITPPIGTPSAGYTDRKGAGMKGVLDPLLATALFIDNETKQVIFCSVDHLGFTYEMVQKITKIVHEKPSLAYADIFIGSSHTHSGGGSYLNIPFLGEALAGPYNPQIEQFYIEKTAEAILKASAKPVQAKIGIGYGVAEKISHYRGLWPVDITPLPDITVLKIVAMDDTPLAVFFNYPLHPTILNSDNRFFSADFVGEAREELKSLLGKSIAPLFFNGAQAEILPALNSCKETGLCLAKSIQAIWDQIEVTDSLELLSLKTTYSFKPEKTPFGLYLPLQNYNSEINLLVIDKRHAFITIPGELSCLYDQSLKETASSLGFTHLSILGLTNDAHGYIILPEAWRHKTYESRLSFGGELYGEFVEKTVTDLLKQGAL